MNPLQRFEILNKKKIQEKLDARSAFDDVKNLRDLPQPDLLKDIDKAHTLIDLALRRGQKIALVGDYDVDGVVASVIVKDFFDFLGKDLEIIIPNRFSDGYGLSADLVDRISADLIITVDNGISALEAVQKAKQRGISVIITDHHACPEILPPADAIINPKQPGCPFKEKNIAGATVAWYLTAYLNKKMQAGYDIKQALDIMAFAIIADAMPLVSINRTLVKAGINYANKSTRQAILALKERLDMPLISSSLVSFSINPRLNSAGRMKSAVLAFEFLYTKDRQKALECLEELDLLNIERKNIEKTILQKAKQMINTSDPVLLAWGDGWHEGVIGIVATRLTELYYKPSIVFSIKDEIAKGSARSKENVNLLELIRGIEDKLEGFGGHNNAAGMRVKEENLKALKSSLSSKIANVQDYDIFNDVLGILPLGVIDLELVDLVQSYEPFGKEFSYPYFLAAHLLPVQVRRFGKESAHLSLRFKNQSSALDVIWFNATQEIEQGKPLSFIYRIDKSTFKGKTRLQALIRNVI